MLMLAHVRSVSLFRQGIFTSRDFGASAVITPRAAGPGCRRAGTRYRRSLALPLPARIGAARVGRNPVWSRVVTGQLITENVVAGLAGMFQPFCTMLAQ